MKKTTFLALVLSAFGLFTANAQTTQFYDGIFVLIEGNFGAEDASLSYFTTDGEFEENVYAAANNNMLLGNTVQSMAFNNDKAYFVLNGSEKLEIAEAGTLQHIATVAEGLDSPRYIAFSNGNAYITCWGAGDVATDDYVAVINLETNTITATIPVAEGPEEIIEANGKIFVAHKGGIGYGSTVSVINPVSNTMVQSLPVGWVPGSLKIMDNVLYVLCEGKPSYSGSETTGSLYRFNIAGNTVSLLSSTVFPGMQHPSKLQINGTDIYFAIEAGIYHTTPNEPTLPTVPLFELPSAQGAYGIYGFNIIDNKFYVGDAVDYVSDSKVYIYDEDGELLEEYTTQQYPNGFYKAPSEPLAVNDVAKTDIAVYPNPATDVIYVSVNKAATVKLYDIAGRIVKNEEYTMKGINLAGLSKGNYFLEINTDNAKTVKQIIIK